LKLFKQFQFKNLPLKEHMKLIKKLFAGSVLAAAVMSANASIIIPNTSGGSELFAVLYTVGNSNSLIVDLGTTISSFNTNNGTAGSPQSFNLAASPYYSTFISNNAGASTVQYAVVGANQFGSTKQLWVTGPVDTIAPVNNANLAIRTGQVNGFVGAVNTGATTPSFSNGHSATDGSSLDTGGNTSSFSVLAGNLSTSLTMVDAGQSAELFRYVTSSSSGTAQSTVTDFFSATETLTNLGGYFTLSATGTLDYFGVPGSVVNPIPEASEWAMMLSGLAMLGLMVRRRRNNV
jgi:hypothetical protein